MYFLWKLVFLAVINIGPSFGSDLENTEDLNKDESRQRTFLSSSDIIAQSKFQCRDKPSGYYADPRYDCKVFHFCNEDGTRTTIPCISDTEEHSICAFRDIVFNACEGSEIYLALPEDLEVKPSKETTASAIISATDFKLPQVLPQPSSPETNHSTTPLSLDFARREKSNSVIPSKESDSIFEVFNSVLREIQAENNPVTTEGLKLSPSTFSRGSKFQASSIRRDDSADTFTNQNNTDDESTFLVEVYNKKNGKVLNDYNPYYKTSKRLFFLPKLEKITPATYPRRKRRTVVEPLNVSRPYAVIYAKVPDKTKTSISKSVKKGANQRKDTIEVPFVAARVPADVPTVPITIETRRKKKSKSKKKTKNSSQTVVAAVLQEKLPQGPGNEEASEQRNVLFFAPEEQSNVDSRNTQSRRNNRQRSQQNRDQPQNIGTHPSSTVENQQNNLHPNYQVPSSQGGNPFQITNFPFQSSAFLSNPASPQYYYTSPELQQPGSYPTYNFQDQFSFRPQPGQVQQPNSYQESEIAQSQPVRQRDRPPTDLRQPENNILPGFRQNSPPQNIRQENHLQLARHPDINSQLTRQTENNPQTIRNAANAPQNIRQTENNPQTIRITANAPQNIRQSENIPPQIYSQPEIHPNSFRQPNNVRQSFRQPENLRIQTVGQPENVQLQAPRPSENAQSQPFRNPENTQPQTLRYHESVPTIRRPEAIQPQPIGQLQNIYLQNVPTFTLGQPNEVFSQNLRRPQNEEQKLNLGTPTNNQEENKNGRERQPSPEQRPSHQRFPSFDNPFFQNFPNFGPINFNNPFTQPSPHSFDLLTPNAVRYQEQLNVPQPINNEDRNREQIPQQIERPQNQVIPHLIISGRPQTPDPQHYGNQPAINHGPGTSVIYLDQPNPNPNLIEAERLKEERSKPGQEPPQLLIAVSEVPRPPRNRGRTTAVVDTPTRPPTRQRNRNPSSQSDQRHSTRRPPENNRLRSRQPQEPNQPASHHRRPTERPRPSTEIVYHPQHHPEISVSEVPNEIHHHYPSTASIQGSRLQESPQPQNIRDDPRVHSQRQPTAQRNRQYYRDNTNGQMQPQYSTHQYTSTTPVPVRTTRQRTRRPENDRPSYDYRTTPLPRERHRTRTTAAREQTTERLPVTNRYFVTSPPRIRQPEEVPNARRPDHHSETRPSRPRSRPQAQVERPSQVYPNAEPVREEHPRSHRYSSHRQQNANNPNDVNVISTVDDSDTRYRTTSSGTERRPGHRGSSSERTRYSPEVEHGFLPVSEKPPREYSYVSQSPGREYSHVTSAPLREYATRPAEREHSRAPEREYSRVPEREYSRAPQREHSYNRAPENDYSYHTRDPEIDYSYNTRAPEREYSRANPAPEIDNPYAPRAPEREYSHPTKVPEMEYREPVNERTRVNRYQNHNEEVPTTRPTTTTPRPTKKKKPLPPRPTFPPFPTFPPPPKRVTTPPPPKTEPPKSEIYETTENIIEHTTLVPHSLRRQRPKLEIVTEISERVVTENYVNTEEPEVTTRRKSRKRRPRPRRPKATTPYSEDGDAIQVESITQATTHKEITTRATPSNYNRWRQQTPSQRKTTSTTPPSPKSTTETDEKSEEFGSRINLFGRPRTRKPAVFTQRATTTAAPSNYDQRRRVTQAPTATRTRKPFAKKVRKRITTTTEGPDTTETIARSDEKDDEISNFNYDANLQALESVTQVAVENMEEYQTTQEYNDAFDMTTETVTVSYEEESQTDSKDKSESFESTRSVSKKFQNRPRILKFGKPRLKTESSS